MDSSQRRTASVTAASALAVLTLVVFYESLNKGPASAVTRYHEALLRSDARMLRQATGGDVNSTAAVVLRTNVAAFLTYNPAFQVARVQKNGLDAVVTVVYRNPRANGVFFIHFALHKTDGLWFVDSAQTLRLTPLQGG